LTFRVTYNILEIVVRPIEVGLEYPIFCLKDANQEIKKRAGHLMVNRGSQDENIWNKNFLLLWLGQFVSSAGDVFYSIALGFFVLEITGSTVLMGTLMAVSMVPRIIISPFAGVVVDRFDRKILLVLMDGLRCIMLSAVTVVAFLGVLKIWMLFVAGIGIGICGTFFNPAVSSSLPDIVPKSKLVKGNSIFGMIYNISGIAGNSMGGFFYAIFGAPLMFLFNASSYFISAGTVVFVKIPKVKSPNNLKLGFFGDMRRGFKFVLDFKALKAIMLLASIVNFFGSIGYILLLPMFERFKQLGPKSYGLVMGFFTGGILAGMLLMSAVNLKPAIRFRVFFPASLLYSLALILVPIYLWLPAMAFLMFVAGLGLAVVNVFISTMIQLVVPQEMRGKIFAFQTTLIGSLMPLAYALGGLLAEFIPIRLLISSCCAIMGLFFIPAAFSPNLKKFINYDPDKDTLKSIL
jgi:DHA3 family macrolide efflux protein-like MFS transporter